MNNLKEWLERHDMTQDELAQALGVSQPHVSRICNGYTPGPAFMWKFFQHFGQSETTAAFSKE